MEHFLCSFLLGGGGLLTFIVVQSCNVSGTVQDGISHAATEEIWSQQERPSNLLADIKFRHSEQFFEQLARIVPLSFNPMQSAYC